MTGAPAQAGSLGPKRLNVIVPVGGTPAPVLGGTGARVAVSVVVPRFWPGVAGPWAATVVTSVGPGVTVLTSGWPVRENVAGGWGATEKGVTPGEWKVCTPGSGRTSLVGTRRVVP